MHTLCALRSPHAVQGCMLAGGMLFRVDFLLLFIAFVNYFLLLKGGNVCYFRVFFFYCSRRGGAPIHMFITNFFVKRIGIDIDLVNDNHYWTILINSATKECSTNPIHKAHLIWSNKNTAALMELQHFM
jgi:hypothetical protein